MKENLYLVITVYHKPKKGVKTETKGWGLHPSMWEDIEVPEIVSRVSTDKMLKSSVVIDLKNDKLIRNRFEKNDPADILRHFKSKYSQYLPTFSDTKNEEKVLMIKSSRFLLTDLDESILVCMEPLKNFCDNKLGKQAVSSVINVCDAYGIDENTAHDLIRAFWRSDVMKTLDPEPCASEVLPRLYAQGWRFVAITACEDAPEIMQARIENLEKAFGFSFEAVHCTGYRSMGEDGKSKKSDVLARYDPTIWVEDNYHNALAGAMLGHKAFLFNREHNENMNHELITRVKNWYEIENYIKENDL